MQFALAGTLLHMTIRRRSVVPKLEVSGLVAEPRIWSWSDLGQIPGKIEDLGEEASGFVGEAVPVSGLLDAASPLAGSTHCTVVSDDGHYRASIPLEEIRAKGWIAFRLDDEPLSRDRGGPLRVVVPQGRTLCWNVKAAVELRITAGPEPDSVPENPPH